MQVTAKLRHLRMSPRKVRLVADVIRGRDVSDAINQLSFMNKRAARPLLKLLNSAVANAENNFKLKKNNLYISELRVDAGPIIKRWQPRAMGRATPINKRTSHICIVLDEKTAITEDTEKTLRTQRKTAITEDAEKTLRTQKKIQSTQRDSEASVIARKALKKEKKKKIDKDVKIVKSLDEVKELEKQEQKLEKAEKPPKEEEYKAEIKDIRRKGKDRRKQHLDTVRKKKKGGFLKRVFRRKSI